MRALTVVAVALVVAILLGLGLNVTQETETTTAYRQIADITPTVQHDPVSQWADLSPTTNWTGFTPQTNFTFTATPDGTVNRYRMAPELPSETEQIADVKDLTAAETFTASSASVHFILVGDGILSNATITGAGYGLTTTINPSNPIKLIALSTVADVGGDDQVEIVFSEPCCAPLISAGSYGAGVGGTVNLWIADLFGSDYAYLAKRVVYSVTGSGDTVTRWYSGYDADNNPVWSYPGRSDDAELYVIAGGVWVNAYPDPGTNPGVFSNYEIIDSAAPAPRAATVITTPFDPDRTDSYMDVRYGIQLQRYNEQDYGPWVYWANGYVNGSVTMIIRIDSGSFTVWSETAYMFSWKGTNGYTEPTISWDYYGEHNIGLGYAAVAVTLDAINQKISVTSLTEANFQDFSNYTLTGYTISDDKWLEPFQRLEMRLTPPLAGTRPATIGIVETTVGTDPNGLLWSDPSVDPPAWFPDATSSDYSVYVRSGTAYGDYMTINGQSFSTSSGGQITIGGSSYPIAGMSIDYTSSGVSVRVQTGTGMQSIPLGELQTAVISWDGVWYLQLDLRSIQTEDKQVYRYDPDAWSSGSAVTVLVIFMALCTVLTMWAIHTKSFSSGEIAIVIAAVGVAWVVLGIFI